MNFTTEEIDKYIMYCKLRADTRMKKYDHQYTAETIQKIYNAECARCLEKYYTRCLKDVYDYNHYTNYTDRKDIAICERIIDAYLDSPANFKSSGASTSRSHSNTSTT